MDEIRFDVKPSREWMYGRVPPQSGFRASGGDVCTFFELPSGLAFRSADFFADIRPATVVEIEGLGKFYIKSIPRIDFVGDGPQRRHAGPKAQAIVQLAAADLSLVETGYIYRPSVPEGATEGVVPHPRAIIGPMEEAQTPKREARLLFESLDALDRDRVPQDIRDHLSRATAIIRVRLALEGETTRVGSGFFVSPHGRLVTSAHVFTGDDLNDWEDQKSRLLGVDVVVKRETGWVTLKAELDKIDLKSDLALLSTLATGTAFLSLAAIPPQEGDVTVAVGYPAYQATQEAITFRWGRITGFVPSVHSSFPDIESSAAIQKGLSGGPLVTANGRVIGVNKEIRGAHGQSRIAVDQMLLRMFLFEEYATGLGYRIGPDSLEDYRLGMSKLNLIFMRLVAELSVFQSEASTPNTDSTPASGQADSEQRGKDLDETLANLREVTRLLRPPAEMQLNHYKVASALATIHEGVVRAILLKVRHIEDSFVGPGKSRFVEPGIGDLEASLSEATNQIQAGLSGFCFAINRIIGRFWSMADDPTKLTRCYCIRWRPNTWQEDQEEAIVSAANGVAARHRGADTIYLASASPGINRWLVIGESCVSGSEAFFKELRSNLAQYGPEVEILPDFPVFQPSFHVTFRGADIAGGGR